MSVIYDEISPVSTEGTPGDDDLHGVTGSDNIIDGLSGNDTIYGGDQWNELRGGDGNDALFGTGSFNTLDGGNGADQLFGGSGFDSLNGGDGNDLLDSGDGDGQMDMLVGGDGNDTYIIHEAELISEDGTSGIDTVKADFTYSLDEQDVDLNGGVLYGDVENLVLLGTAEIDGYGNRLNNAMTGNGAANTLEGKDGNDKLWGGGGNDALDGGTGDDWVDGGYGHDILTGGTGRDSFVFGPNFAIDAKTGIADLTFISASSDTVKDFHRGEDLILLSMKAFGLKGNAGDMLDEKWFRDYAYANTADQRILYDAKTGELWFDHNGNGSDPMGDGTQWTGRRLIATFTDDHGQHPVKLDVSDFMLIA